MKRNLHFIVQIEEPIRRAQDDARSPNATENDSIDTLCPQNRFELVTGACVVSRFLQDDISSRFVDVESRIKLRGSRVCSCEWSTGSLESRAKCRKWPPRVSCVAIECSQYRLSPVVTDQTPVRIAISSIVSIRVSR